MWQRQIRRCSLRESINAVEADIHHANTLVAALPRDIREDNCFIQMKLSSSPFAPLLMFVLEWMDCSCFDTFLTCLGLFHVLVYQVYVDDMPIANPEERRASLREFYAVIYPMLKQLEGNLEGLTRAPDDNENKEEDDEEEECGICMEMDCRVALPNCGHSMCITCFEEWYVRSRSCPFCRGSLKRVTSADLWVLTSRSNAVDAATLAKDSLRSFYLYVQNLPLLAPQDSLLMYNYLI
ncbi:E3 ubiquitin-protein ligase AIRP2-like [Salvia hispanica]|uniref:E3 ubiquitin-protein ligase AIRP2-like n=1 Tax=Salvia hispanica TaxID=49212 RepID=UPI0020090540|nr:E3 ubiquitin-protein ligase AIRP2-like [Salvia hispanica]